MRSETRNAGRCWQLASARLDIGPGRTGSAGNQGQAQHGPSSEAQQPVKGCRRGRRFLWCLITV